VNRLRRHWLGRAAALPLAFAVPARAWAAPQFAAIGRGALRFPRDRGAHPDTRIEWWYLTGQLEAPATAAVAAGAAGPGAAPIGLQLTFFRMATGLGAGNPSAFAPRQLLLAHAAIADARRGQLLHDERLARSGFGLAQADLGDTRVAVGGWQLQRDAGSGRYAGQVAAGSFALTFSATPTQPPLLQGEQGYSIKGADVNGQTAASDYYSEPQLRLEAQLTIDGQVENRQGWGWLDHEWSSTLLPPDAAGWDWGGYNLTDGTALTLFRVRGRTSDAGGRTLHAYAALRSPDQAPEMFPAAAVGFVPLEYWTSPRTHARYPVAQRFQVGRRIFETRPLMPDQEYDARTSSAVAYWEGASTLFEGGRAVGRGYLELTGYAGTVPGAAAGR
jgi:predicted secreted hydrolase